MMSRALSGSASGTRADARCPTSPISPARMQRTWWSGAISRSSGTSSLQASITNSQRSWNRQPSGRAPGAGVRPGMPLSARAWLRCGIESSSARV